MFCIYVIKNTAGANSSAINKYATTTKFIYDAYRKKQQPVYVQRGVWAWRTAWKYIGPLRPAALKQR